MYTVAELVAGGVLRSTVNHRCRSGRWTRLLPGVVATGHPGYLARCCAVTTWQPRAVLSHRTAAWVWGLCDEPEVVEATVPRTANVRAPEWVALHRRRMVDEGVATARGLAVVTPGRALFDCISVLAPAEADVFVDAALQRGASLRALAEHCRDGAGSVGVVEARRQLREAAVGARSEPERVGARALARRGWRLPANCSMQGWVCDFVDELSRTVVEIDGREPHSEPETFRRDRRRQNALLGSGRHVLRYAAFDALVDPEEVADDIIAVLRRRRAARR